MDNKLKTIHSAKTIQFYLLPSLKGKIFIRPEWLDQNGNDLKVYELMDPNRFATEVKGEQPEQPKPNFFGLAADLKPN